MTTTKSLDESPLAQFNFPRTGKRGVPQQFPRHLYEMLDCESRLIETDANHARIISWSDSGRAFRIYNVSEFSLSILPRYFRTKKFSSFQRNLNLYGFTKVRRGNDLDMYAHPSFIRDDPESLLQLRKLGGARKRTSPLLRSVSPSTGSSVASDSHVSSFNLSDTSSPLNRRFQVEQTSMSSPSFLVPMTFKGCGADEQRGCLDLLALAMEQATYL